MLEAMMPNVAVAYKLETYLDVVYRVVFELLVTRPTGTLGHAIWHMHMLTLGSSARLTMIPQLLFLTNFADLP